ncbi:unnamed protein product [Albugo candida]|uniref:Uncharacterized protein n=1 Tax=Albugo candida TaxID=65357 RepID=A0A024FSW0_9STRA|nr:unnamed protein product [Albugo candida]|eukprot:CCI10123.1 unnamed protein product [Albugo candida]
MDGTTCVNIVSCLKSVYRHSIEYVQSLKNVDSSTRLFLLEYVKINYVSYFQFNVKLHRQMIQRPPRKVSEMLAMLHEGINHLIPNVWHPIRLLRCTLSHSSRFGFAVWRSGTVHIFSIRICLERETLWLDWDASCSEHSRKPTSTNIRGVLVGDEIQQDKNRYVLRIESKCGFQYIHLVACLSSMTRDHCWNYHQGIACMLEVPMQSVLAFVSH